MDPIQFALLRGEWTGNGTMTIGPDRGDVVEYVRMDATDSEGIVSYIRKSRITFPTRVGVHNECGFIRLRSVGLMLHRGTYNILEWDDASESYIQVAGSPDTKLMTRKITLPHPDEMFWYNSMEVLRGGVWVNHVVETRFFSLLKASSKSGKEAEEQLW